MRCSMYAVLLFAMMAFSCASRSGVTGMKTGVMNPAGLDPSVLPQMVLNRYTVEFKIPNPLADDDGMSARRSDPSHEGIIICRATLLDSISTEADMHARCRADSLDAAASAAFREKYEREEVQPGRFRIRISMESGFSPMSIDPRHWAIYLADARGILIEPVQVKTAAASTREDSLYSDYYRRDFRRVRITGDIVLYFDRVTFFGEDILGPGNPFVALEMARNQKTVARVIWKNAAAESKRGKHVRTER